MTSYQNGRPSGKPEISGSGDFEVMIPPPAPLSLSLPTVRNQRCAEKETDLYTYPPGN